ncbi:MAG: hypothetical protein AAF702_10715 [Chloroflexota bacterium]
MSKLIRMSVLYPFITATLLLAGVYTAYLVEPNADAGSASVTETNIILSEKDAGEN